MKKTNKLKFLAILGLSVLLIGCHEKKKGGGSEFYKPQTSELDIGPGKHSGQITHEKHL